ncbi:hypothetical protein [Mesorhizobium caraganae]|uniref:hypothetical protein n=1 Tax=Mesorhizobium caraganae TaxID=483206 RepID=UPI00333D36DA
MAEPDSGSVAGDSHPFLMNAVGAFTIQPVEFGSDEFCQPSALVEASPRDNSPEGVGAFLNWSGP